MLLSSPTTYLVVGPVKVEDRGHGEREHERSRYGQDSHRVPERGRRFCTRLQPTPGTLTMVFPCACCLGYTVVVSPQRPYPRMT
jgi:hypothetical protein